MKTASTSPDDRKMSLLSAQSRPHASGSMRSPSEDNRQEQQQRQAPQSNQDIRSEVELSQKSQSCVIAEGRGGDETDPESECSESECSSTFSSGKHFWIAFLEENDSESLATEESRQRKAPTERKINRTMSNASSASNYSSRKTPTGREINRTMSNASSVTNCSSFRQQKITPRGFVRSPAAAWSPDSLSSTSPDEHQCPERRKMTFGNHWKSPQASPPMPNELTSEYQQGRTIAIPDCKSSATPGSTQHLAPQSAQNQPVLPSPRSTKASPLPSFPRNRFSFSNIPSASSPRVAGQLRQASPRAFGEDKTNISSARTTPQNSTVTSTSKPLSQRNRQQQHPIPGFIENRLMISHSVNRSASPEVVAYKNVFKSSKFVIRNESPAKQTEDSKVGKALAMKEKSPRNIYRKPQADSIEIQAPPIPRFSSEKAYVVGKLQLPKISPRTEHQDHFQLAYEAWHRAGLMHKKVVKREISPRILSGMSSFQLSKSLSSKSSEDQQLEPVPSSEEFNLHTSEDLLQLETVKTSEEINFQHSEDDSSCFTTPTSADGSHHPENNHPSSRHSDRSAFRNILRQWRDKSDDKPNPHFLSPTNSHYISPTNSRFISPTSSHFISPTNSRFISPTNSQFLFPEQNLGLRDSTHEKENSKDSEMTGSARKKISYRANASRDAPVQRGEETIDEAPLVTKRINEYNRDYFDLVREGRKTSPGDEPLNKTPTRTGNDPLSTHFKNIRNYIDCDCSRSIFSGNDDLIDFFLPQLGMACSCGKQSPGIVNPDVPTALENVLRPWQCHFLKGFGIHRGEQLVKARHRSGQVISKVLRYWRAKHGMPPFGTSSCAMAIDIWAKTCKAYVRSIRKQLDAGVQLLEKQPAGLVLRELSHFLSDEPQAPKRRAAPRIKIEPESQAEV
jgi:hypothetical protein